MLARYPLLLHSVVPVYIAVLVVVCWQLGRTFDLRARRKLTAASKQWRTR